jgi:hypothetical protein
MMEAGKKKIPGFTVAWPFLLGGTIFLFLRNSHDWDFVFTAMSSSRFSAPRSRE